MKRRSTYQRPSWQSDLIYAAQNLALAVGVIASVWIMWVALWMIF